MLLLKPEVRPAHRKNTDGSVRKNWLIYCGTDEAGSPVKYYRSSEKKARELSKQMSEKVKRVGQAAALLTAAQVYDSSEAFQALVAAGATVSLTECARQWIERNRDVLQCRTVRIKDCFEEYMARFDQSKEHYKSVKNLLFKMIDPFGDLRRMSDIDRTVVESFLGLYDNPKSFNLNRGYILAFLHWARKNGKYPQSQYDACLCIERKREPYRSPVFVHADVAEKIMRWCESQPDADMIAPKFAIGFFAGIRSDEIERMDWSNVHFDTAEIRVETPKGVTGTPPRIVSMSDNLVAWLKLYSKTSGKMCYSGSVITDRKRKISEKIGMDIDSKDMRNFARHTFATMHTAFHRDFALTASEMGHGANTTMLMKHYKSITSKDDAAAFWSIMPTRRVGGQAVNS